MPLVWTPPRSEVSGFRFAGGEQCFCQMTATSDFYRGLGVLNFDPRVFMANTLSTEPTPQPGTTVSALPFSLRATVEVSNPLANQCGGSWEGGRP